MPCRHKILRNGWKLRNILPELEFVNKMEMEYICIHNYGEKMSPYCTKYINVYIYPLYKCNFRSKYPHVWKSGWKLWLTRTQIRGKYIYCGEPAISHDFHHVSLVQWTTCLLPTTRDTGSNPLGELMWNRDSPVSVVSLHWWLQRDSITGFVTLKVPH
jgi:hypothetical protein